MMKFYGLLFGAVLFTLVSCQSPSIEEPDVVIVCMDSTHVFFAPSANWDSINATDGWRRMDNGRFLTQTMAMPQYQVRPKITAHITLQSAGDPWDKSGSFVLLPNAAPNLLDVGFTNQSISETDYPGIAINESNTGFHPTIELLRFITPFGVGYFSESTSADEYKPVYIPKWEDSVQWVADISHLWEALGDSATFGVYLDTWTGEGYSMDIHIEFKAKPETVVPGKSLATIPLVNTTKFGSKQRAYDRFSISPLEVDVALEKPASNAVLYYTATGHGGHGTGDEFVRCKHHVIWDGDTCLSFTPWRDDCASFRRFNPTSGVWMKRTKWKGDSLDERIASSDYSRSGWCPGSDIPPVCIPLGELDTGAHKLVINVPTAQPFTDSEMNFWNVAAYLTYEHP